MINIKSIYLVVVAAMVLGLSSCKDYFGDTNLDPDNPSTVTPGVLLPSAQVRLAYLVGGDASRYTSIMTQHIAGISRQFLVIHNYGLQGADVNTMWGQNTYAGVLQDLKQLANITTEAPHYTGITQVLKAYTFMLTTDLFGDIPFSEALQAPATLQPGYETQQSVYTQIQDMLDKAIANFALAGGPITPGGDDLIYGGDITLWTKLAYTLKARGYLHLGAKDNTNYTSVLTNLTNGFTSSADDTKLAFGTDATANSPWYQYNIQRGDCDTNTTHMQRLRDLNDPRTAMFGVELPENDAHPYFTNVQSQILLSFTEMKFMEAEARMQTEGATAATHQAYLDAINASFVDLRMSASYSTYAGQSSVDPGAANLTLEHIMTQKYLALYTQPEVYNDWRRTGFPALTPNSGAQIPTRFPYPEDEVQLNADNCPQGVTLFDKVWWDM